MELNNYINIFNKEFAGELLFNYLGDHVIKINNKNPLYGPLYNLSTKKLEVLCQYINKILEKRWIKPFTLFMPKKDKIL